MKKYAPLILLVIALGANVFLRVSTAFLPSLDDQARQFAINEINNAAKKQVDEQFKDMPDQAKFKVKEDLAKAWQKEQKKYFKELIKNKQKELKSEFQDEQGQTFLLELDPYHWFRLVKNFESIGKVGDKVIKGVEYDSFMLAPEGMEAGVSLHKNFHVYLSAFLFKIIKFFNRDIALTHFVFYIPVFISTLALIVLFLLCLSLSSSGLNIAGFLAVMSLGLAPMFLQRSLGGWFDTDPYVVLFSLLSVWIFYLSIRQKTPLKRVIILSVVSGIIIGLFSFTWDGWWYIFDLLILSALYYLLNLCILKKDTHKKIEIRLPLVSLISFILSSLVFAVIFSGQEVARHFITGPIKLFAAKDYLGAQFWPNTFLTVGELRKVGMLDIFESIGGVVVLLSALFYLLFILADKKSKDYASRQFIGFLFIFWIAVMLYVSSNAIRFSLLLAVPAAVCFGLFWEKVFDYLSRLIGRLWKMPKIKEALIAVFVILFLLFAFDKALTVSETEPLMNKSWWRVLNEIKIQTPKSAILNSWWDYGHWFKAIAERRVIFDGATQNTPMSYWMGRVFLTDNETEATGILRMLNSGSNKAFEELEKLGFDKSKCMSILNEIIMVKRKDAEAILTKYVSKKEDRDRVLMYTHNPNPAYFIVEPSLMPKMAAISFLGGWDFKKADIYNAFQKYKKDDFIDYLIKRQNYAKEEALKLYNNLVFLNKEDALAWISPKYKYHRQSVNYIKDNNVLFFDNNFVVDLSNYHAYFNNMQTGKWGIPKSIFYLEAGALKEVALPGNDSSVSFLLLKDKEDYKLVVLDGVLARSMLTRMYFLKGEGLKNFTPLIKEELKDSRGRIIVYKIEWDK